MPPLPSTARRRRPRRGSLDRPLNARLYRGAWLFAVIPLLLLAFTVSTPAALTKPSLPETFNTGAAMALTRDLAIGYPDRAPGSAGAGDGHPLSGATAWFLRELQGYGLAQTASSWFADLPGRGRVELTNITAVAQGQSPEAIVVMAHRDDLGVGPGADDNASGTAVLIELARAYAEPHGVTRVSVQPAHTLIFLSTDGGAFGGLGAVRFLHTSPYRHRIAAVINLDALAGAGAPRLEIAGDRPRAPNTSFLATAAARIREQTGTAPAHVDVLGQLIDLGFPFTLDEQGPFNAAGIPALTLTTGGVRPPAPFGDTPDLLQGKQLGVMGQAAEELLGSLNQDVQLAPATASYVWVGARTVTGWAIALLLISLLMPFAVTVVDFYALCRRNQIRLAPAVRALRSRLGFWLFGGAVFTCFRLLGVWPSGEARPPNPASPLSAQRPVLGIGCLLVLLVAGWAVSRQRLVLRRRVTAEEQLAGYLIALVALLLVALLVAATNPFALIFVLPALHTWLWLPQVRIARAPVRVFLFILGLAGPALLLASLAFRFGLGADALWYLTELVANGYISTLAFAVTLTAAAAAAQLAAASAGRYAPYPSGRERGPRGPVRDVVRAAFQLGRGVRRGVALRRGALGTYRAR